MRFSALLVILLAAGCDHRPPSKQDTPSTKSAPPPSDAGAAVAPAGDDACLQIGVKLADIIISATTDPTQKAAYEQERTKLVKRFSDNCQRETWPEATRSCFMAAKSPAEVEVCSRDLAKAAAGSAGSAGSAAGSAAGSGVR